MVKDTSYNGWKNRSTWNVMLWINNDEGFYNSAVKFMKTYKGRKPYGAFIVYMGMQDSRTDDGIKWFSRLLDYKTLNEAMLDFLPSNQQ